MKKLFAFALLLILITSYGYAQSGWFWLNPGIDGFFEDIIFVNDSIGYVSGSYYGNASSQGQLVCLKTTDKGLSWNCNYIQGVYPLSFDMYFLDQNTGWIVGGLGSICKTTNGAINWVRLPYPNNNDLVQSVYFINSLTGFVGVISYQSEALGIVYKTTDGGQNWITSTSGFYPSNILFINSNTGFAYGHNSVNSSGIIRKTTNTGESWFTCNYPSDMYSGWAMCFINNIGFICSNPVEKIYKSTDLGNNWYYLTTLGSYHYIQDMFFLNSDTGWAIGRSALFKTTNSGVTWNNQIEGPSNFYFTSIYFTNANTGYAVSDQWLLKTITGGGNPTGIISGGNVMPSEFALSQNYPNPFNPSTKIRFCIPLSRGVSEGSVRRTPLEGVLLIVYDLLGREVATLVNEELKPGTYEADWDASNFSSGVYFYKIITEDFVETKKMVLMK